MTRPALVDGWACIDCGKPRYLVTVCTGCHTKRHARPPDVLHEKRRAWQHNYYLAHREERIARAVAYQRGYRARKSASIT